MGRRVGRDVSLRWPGPAKQRVASIDATLRFPGPGQPEGSRRLVALKRGVGATNLQLVVFIYLSRRVLSRQGAWLSSPKEAGTLAFSEETWLFPIQIWQPAFRRDLP